MSVKKHLQGCCTCGALYLLCPDLLAAARLLKEVLTVNIVKHYHRVLDRCHMPLWKQWIKGKRESCPIDSPIFCRKMHHALVWGWECSFGKNVKHTGVLVDVCPAGDFEMCDSEMLPLGCFSHGSLSSTKGGRLCFKLLLSDSIVWQTNLDDVVLQDLRQWISFWNMAWHQAQLLRASLDTSLHSVDWGAMLWFKHFH